MPAADSSQKVDRRRSSKGRVRAIEYARRAVTGTEPSSPTYARYIGRVGALAVALGVGSGLGSLPMAFADTTGSAGSSAADSSTSSRKSTAARAPRNSGRGSADAGSVPSGSGSDDAANTGGAVPRRARGQNPVAATADTAVPRRKNSEAVIADDAPAEDAPADVTPDPSEDIAGSPGGTDADPAPIFDPINGTDSGAPAPVPVPASAVGSIATAAPAAVVDEVPANAPVITAAPRGSVNSMGSGLLSWLASGIGQRWRFAGGGAAGLGGGGGDPPRTRLRFGDGQGGGGDDLQC